MKFIPKKSENLNSAEKDYKVSEKKDKPVIIKRPWKDYKLHVSILIIVIIAELIGAKKIVLSPTVSIVIMPLLFSMVLGLILFLFKPFKSIGLRQAKISEGAMLLFIGPLIAKLAISSGQSIFLLFNTGPALLLQEIGNLGTIFLALPIAIYLGFKRESIGMTSSIGREPNIAVIIDKFGFDSAETRGILTVFVIGTVIGTLYISFLASMSISLLPLHPYAFAMASGVGSASMNAAAFSPLINIYPELSTKIEAFAGFSNLISFCIGIYVCIFVSIPLTEKLYSFLEPTIGKKQITKEKQ